jgi:four helix bundle protein
MSRDPTRLRVFQDAHQLTLSIYRSTRRFPREEWFGLRSQMRRAAVSIPTNLVEGSARSSSRDYLRFLYVALGSACELKYLVRLSSEVGYVGGEARGEVEAQSEAVVRQLERLVQQVERFSLTETARPRRRTSNPEPGSP